MTTAAGTRISWLSFLQLTEYNGFPLFSQKQCRSSLGDYYLQKNADGCKLAIRTAQENHLGALITPALFFYTQHSVEGTLSCKWSLLTAPCFTKLRSDWVCTHVGQMLVNTPSLHITLNKTLYSRKHFSKPQLSSASALNALEFCCQHLQMSHHSAGLERCCTCWLSNILQSLVSCLNLCFSQVF